MNILVITHYYPTHGGGIERATADLLARLVSLGHRFTWVAGDCDDAPTLAGVSCRPARCWNGIERHGGLPLPLWSPSDLLALNDLVRSHDAVWLHDTLYVGQLAAAGWAMLRRRPLLITQHVGPIPYPNVCLRGLQGIAFATLGRPVLRHAAAVFVSDAVAKALLPDHPRATVIPFGVDAGFFSPAAPEAGDQRRKDLGLQANGFVALFAGRMVERKGLAVIRTLAQIFPDITFVLCGAGPINPAAWQLANVDFRGPVAPLVLRDLYRSADLFLLPSLGEGFPLVVQEAMACGLPVLCSPETAAGCEAAAPYLLQAMVDLQRPEPTAQRWANIITALQQKPAALNGRTAAAFAAAHWSWDKTVAAYDRLFKQLV